MASNVSRKSLFYIKRFSTFLPYSRRPLHNSRSKSKIFVPNVNLSVSPKWTISTLGPLTIMTMAHQSVQVRQCSVKTRHTRLPKHSFQTVDADADVPSEVMMDYDLDIGQPESFEQLGVKPSLCRVLKENGILLPTNVQYRGLPVTMSHKRHCIIQSETGTGKTLTFLLPALQEQLPGLTTLVLIPTRELAVQTYHQAKKLSINGRDKRAKRVMVVFSGDTENEDDTFADVRPHILIGTPKRVLQLLDTNKKDFALLRRVVLDEVDKLLLLPNKRSAKKLAVRDMHPRPAKLIIEKLLSFKRRCKTQLIATSATVDIRIKEELSMLGWGPEPEIISTSEINNRLVSPEVIQHCLLSCHTSREAHSEGYDKLDALIDHFRVSGEKSALVFIHRDAPISKFLYDLRKRGMVAEALHENCLNPSQYEQFLEDFKSGKIEMVVATEETVRGLDFVWLTTVYLMVVPRSASEYLHLCGRVGRVGRQGRAIVILEDEKERTRMISHYMKLHVQGKELNFPVETYKH